MGYGVDGIDCKHLKNSSMIAPLIGQTLSYVRRMCREEEENVFLLCVLPVFSGMDGNCPACRVISIIGAHRKSGVPYAIPPAPARCMHVMSSLPTIKPYCHDYDRLHRNPPTMACFSPELLGELAGIRIDALIGCDILFGLTVRFCWHDRKIDIGEDVPDFPFHESCTPFYGTSVFSVGLGARRVVNACL